MKIGFRLALTFGAVLVLLLVICVTVGMQMSRMNADTQFIITNRNAKIARINQTKEAAYFTALSIYRTLDEQAGSGLEQIQDSVKQNSVNYKEIGRMLTTADGRASFAHLTQVREAYLTALRPVYAQLAAHDNNGARATMLGMVPYQIALFKALNDLRDLQQIGMDAAVQESVNAYATARAVLWGLAALGLIIATVLCVIVTRSIVRPLQRVVDGAEALAQGDLSVKIDVLRRDEVGAASQEQRTGIEQVNQAVSQMDQVTQQNAALVEQATAAAQAMADQAQALREAVAVFNVGDSDSVSVPLAAIPRRIEIRASEVPFF